MTKKRFAVYVKVVIDLPTRLYGDCFTKGLCVITQLADTPTYARTIHHLSMHPPSILLVPASASYRAKHTASASMSRSGKRAKTLFRNDGDTDRGSWADASQNNNQSVLVRILEQLFSLEAHPFPRRHWDHEEGETASPRKAYTNHSASHDSKECPSDLRTYQSWAKWQERRTIM